MIRVTYRVRYGLGAYGREEETYLSPEMALRGITERVKDPFSSTVHAVEVRDNKGRAYDLEWSAVLVPREHSPAQVALPATAEPAAV